MLHNYHSRTQENINPTGTWLPTGGLLADTARQKTIATHRYTCLRAQKPDRRLRAWGELPGLASLNGQIIRIWAARTAELIGRVQAQIGDTSRARGSGPVTRAGYGASPGFPGPARFRAV